MKESTRCALRMSITNRNLAFRIQQMAHVDQRARMLCVPGEHLENLVVYAIDQIHHTHILEIIGQYGYPMRVMIGKRALRAFWILVQHQDLARDLQAQCLERCDFEPKERALITDRVLVAKGMPQQYGTQFHRTKRGHVLRPIADRRHVDERRKAVGLTPIAENIAKMLARDRQLARRATRRRAT